MTTPSRQERLAQYASVQPCTVFVFRGSGGRAQKGESITPGMSHMITEELGLPEPLTFDRDDAGRPRITSGPLAGVGVSTSSVPGHRAVAVSLDGPVGVDLETVQEEHGDDILRERTCSPGERLACAACSTDGHPPMPASAFTRLWTRKEAALKLLGTGLVTDPRAVTVNCCGPATGRDGTHLARVHTARLTPAVWLSTATAHGTPPEVVELDLDDQVPG